MRVGRSVSAAAFTALLAASCVGGGANGASGRRELTVAIEQGWISLDPIELQNVTENSIGTALYDKLLDVDERGNFLPRLAVDWRTDDGLIWEIRLRDGVRFHDGTPFDAEAVRKNFLRLSDPANRCVCLSELQTIRRIETSSSNRLTFHLGTRLASFPAVLAGFPGMIPSPTALARYGAEYPHHPVGAGPFEFRDQIGGGRLRLQRFDGYWEPGHPFLDGITFVSIPDPQARLTALEAGDVQVAEAPLPQQIRSARANSTLEVTEAGGLGIFFLIANLRQEPLDDLAARQALARSIDVEKLNEAVFGGLNEPIQSPFPTTLWASPGSVAEYPAYDPGRAADLVEELGDLSISLAAPAPSVTVAQALVDMWRRAGIEVELSLHDPVALRDIVRTHSFQLVLTRFAGRWDPDLYAYPWFHSTGAFNQSGVSDPELDGLLEAARSTLDRSERTRLYADVAGRLGELLPHIYLTSFVFYRLQDGDVAGIPANPDGILRLGSASFDGQ